jgi:uncharacterized protein
MANLVGKVKRQITTSEDGLAKFKSNGVSDIEAIGAAESRITNANDILENLNGNNSGDIIPALAFAHERARTAQWWLSLAVPSGKTISEDILKERSGWYLSQAQSMSTYTQALLTESGISVVGMVDIVTIQKEIDRGFYSGAIFDSLKIISRLSTGIELMGIEDPSIRVNKSAKGAQSMINEVRSRGIEPTLAVSIFESGESSNNPYEKKSDYSYARMVAKVTESLYSHETSNGQIMIENGIMIPDVLSTSDIQNTKSNVSNITRKSPAFVTIDLIGVMMFVLYLTRWRRR